jgi:hypothetical protein
MSSSSRSDGGEMDEQKCLIEISAGLHFDLIGSLVNP